MYDPVRYLPILADALQFLFGWCVVVLALVRALPRTMDVKRWQRWLRFGVLLGLIGGLVGLVAIAAWLLGMACSPDAEVQATLTERLSGPYAWGFWLSWAVQLLLLAALTVARIRASWWLAWFVALLMSLPFERLVIIITSMHRDYLPSGWTTADVAWSFFALPVTLLVSALVMLRAQRGRRSEDRSV